VNGRQVRKFNAAWSKDEAQTALSNRLDEIRAGAVPPEHRTLGDVVGEYLRYKTERGSARFARTRASSTGASCQRSAPSCRYASSPAPRSRSTNASAAAR
jgi:hypothetical protein